MKYAVCIEYDGTHYKGWQRQGHAPSVQAELEKALSKLANHAIDVSCAGRTDSGVHGIGQVIHFESDAKRDEKAWRMGCNTNLPDDIALRWIQPVSAEFHARFSATARTYRYIILNRKTRPALLQNRVYWHYLNDQPLNEKRMHQAAQYLLGEHDFSSFRAAGCQAKHAMRELQSIQVSRQGDFVYVDIRANAFLHHMVRNIVGSLLEVGAGLKPAEWFIELLALKDRDQAGVTAVACGLYFVSVEYPVAFNLPSAALPPVFRL